MRQDPTPEENRAWRIDGCNDRIKTRPPDVHAGCIIQRGSCSLLPEENRGGCSFAGCVEEANFFFGCWFAERDWQCEVRLPPFPLFTLEIFDTKARRREGLATNTQGDPKYSGNRFEVKQHRKLNGVYLSVILMLDPSFSHST